MPRPGEIDARRSSSLSSLCSASSRGAGYGRTSLTNGSATSLWSTCSNIVHGSIRGAFVGRSSLSSALFLEWCMSSRCLTLRPIPGSARSTPFWPTPRGRPSSPNCWDIGAGQPGETAKRCCTDWLTSAYARHFSGVWRQTRRHASFVPPFVPQHPRVDSRIHFLHGTPTGQACRGSLLTRSCRHRAAWGACPRRSAILQTQMTLSSNWPRHPAFYRITAGSNPARVATFKATIFNF